LKKGKNTITIFEQKNEVLQNKVSSIDTPILQDLRPKKGQ